MRVKIHAVEQRVRVILTAGGLAREEGGPSRSVPALAWALAALQLEVEMVTCEPATDQTAPLLPQESLVKARLLPRSCRTTQWLARTNGFAGALAAASRGVKDCVFHDNGVLLPTNHAVAFSARRLNRPLIVSPRGMLTPWALHFRGLKKRVAWWLYQRWDLQFAQVLHATSQVEAKELRSLGLAQPIAVIPNGVSLPPQPTADRPPQSGIRTILFLSRIHPKKGLLDLVKAWSSVRANGWRVTIAGGDADGHLKEVKSEIRRLKVEHDFEFVGEINGEAKWELYRSANLFVLPTKSENFGIVIAEALACGVPVITTKCTPWEELITHRCGWWIGFGAEPLIRALNEAMPLRDGQRREMGERGRKLVAEIYTWPGAARKMVSVYEWLLGHGPEPECVV
jgi:glycosyltransferase involved in cell wall biosynthesis